MPGSKSTRKRKLTGPSYTARTGLSGSGVNLPNYRVTTDSYPGTQVTESEGHQWPPPKGAKLTDRGGSFRTTMSEVLSPRIFPVTKLSTFQSPYLYSYTGPLTPNTPGSENARTFPPTFESSDSQLDKDGAVAISRCKPTNSIADASTFLGELVKEGLPSIVGHTTWKNRAAKARKNAASEFLGIQFGWLPLVAEVQNFATAVKKADKILAQYERDAGRVVRRRYYFPTETSSTTTTYASNTYVQQGATHIPARQAGQGDVLLTRVIERKKWFSGAFTYHLPAGYDSRQSMTRLAAQADKLFGVNVTPETLWNVAPWSWAVDWFSNTGEVIGNLEDFKLYGLVMRYGYMMETTIVTDTYTFVAKSGFNPTSAPKVAPVVLRTTTKKRRPANPFGFGLTWEGLSPLQLAIAAALGISKSS